MRIAPKQTLFALFQLFLFRIDPKRTHPKRSFINLFLSFSFITTDVFPSSRPDTSPTEAIATTNSTVGAPGSTEKSTEIDREQMIIIVVCVSIIVLFIIGAAVYFLGFKRCREEKGKPKHSPLYALPV